MKIYLIKDGKEAGPFTVKQVQRWVIEGVISPGNLAWREGLADWVLVSDLLPRKASKKITDKIKSIRLFINKNGEFGTVLIFMIIITFMLSIDTYFQLMRYAEWKDREPEYWYSPKVYEYQHDGVDYVIAETRYGLGICPKSSWKGVRITVTNTVENLPLPEIALEEYQPKEANE
tara:strand:+ start:686 stop:1210 length:525 start_codon:yes stop_codon:yes gene_type:complete